MDFLRRLLRGGGGRGASAGGPHAHLIRDCQKAADEITAYLAARARKVPSADPQTRDNAAWHEAQNNHAQYMMDTMSEYRDRFEPRVKGLRDELGVAGVSDPAFDDLVDHAGNPDRARQAAETLSLLARRLDPRVAALEKVYASSEVVDAE